MRYELTSANAATKGSSLTTGPPARGTLKSSKTSFVAKSERYTTRLWSGLRAKLLTVRLEASGSEIRTGAELPSLATRWRSNLEGKLGELIRKSTSVPSAVKA